VKDLEEIIKEHYLTNDETYNSISDYIMYKLIANGFKVEDIEKLLVRMLKIPDRAKFKTHLFYKYDYDLKCAVCGIKEGLQIHHLQGKASYPELEYDESNVCFLCDSCHKIVHHGGGNGTDIKLKSKIKSIFKQRMNGNIY